MCDLDGLLCNFWRALRADPEAVAYWAAWPTIHQDLTARHTWLRQWRAEHVHKVETDPDFYDPKVAGWWVWGLSNWIGGGWCTGKFSDKRPLSNQGQGGATAQGVQAQRGGQGQRPHVNTLHPGQGVQAQRVGFQGSPDHVLTGDILDGSRWQLWFAALAKRLERVVVLNRSWESAVTPSLLQQTPSAPKPPVGIFLDPPYLTHDRDNTIYQGDEQADDVARKALAWAVEHGDKYRIAYACGAAHFDVPDGWEAQSLTFAGIRDEARRAKQPATVLDPFCGSGTTGVVALRHGRSFVGIELNAEYVALARQRIVSDAPMFNTNEAARSQ